MTATVQHPTGARDDNALLFRFTDRIEHDLAAVLTGCTTLIHVEPDDGPPQIPHKAVDAGGKRPR